MAKHRKGKRVKRISAWNRRLKAERQQLSRLAEENGHATKHSLRARGGLPGQPGTNTKYDRGAETATP